MLKRTALLLGQDETERLCRSSVVIFGVGGVGSYVAEAVARSGIGRICLVDGESFDATNINRQLGALNSTIGQNKAEVTASRLRDINPGAQITCVPRFYTGDEVDLSGFDYVADCIDSVSAKIALIENTNRLGIPIISCMGAGNRLDPTRFRVTDLFSTTGCALARVMRHELRKRGITRLTVVFSDEPAISTAENETNGGNKKIIGSVSFVPSVAGLILAGEIIKALAFE